MCYWYLVGFIFINFTMSILCMLLFLSHLSGHFQNNNSTMLSCCYHINFLYNTSKCCIYVLTQFLCAYNSILLPCSKECMYCICNVCVEVNLTSHVWTSKNNIGIPPNYIPYYSRRKIEWIGQLDGESMSACSQTMLTSQWVQFRYMRNRIHQN